MKASLGCALALVGASLAVRVEAQTIVIGPRASSISAQPGAVFTVPVVADLTGGGGASLGSVSGRLTWRPAALRFVEASLGTAGPVVFNPDTATGVLRFALANASGATGTAVLVNVTFRVTATPGDTTRLAVSLDELTAAQTFANLLRSAVLTPALFCAAGGRFGDIDGNDSLKSNDALYIVTNAVGLPITPYTVVNGDVDNDGKVDTRDALIVLTYVVGLPTPGFRVGQLNTFGCGITAAKTVSLQPVAAALNVGDQVPLAATARDSTNAITSATFQWLSRDTMVARVRPAHVEAVGTGTTRVVVVVAPGVMDSVTVSVTGARRVWYVDQAVAASQPVELGSQTYPFATVQAAVGRAAPDDTVRVAVADYGDAVRITRALVVIGDSTAAGFPRIRNGTGPAVSVDSVASGTVRLERLRLQDSQGGVIARGSGTAVLDLRGVIVERSRSRGVDLVGLDAAHLFRVVVDGAVDAGIAAEHVGLLHLVGSSVALVAGLGDQVTGHTLRAAHVDTVIADSVSLRMGSVELDSVGVLRMRRSLVTESAGPLLVVHGVASAVLDTVEFAQAGSGDQWSDPAVIFEHEAPANIRLTGVVLRDVARGIYVRGPGGVTMRHSAAVPRGSPASVWTDLAGFHGVDSVRIAESSFVDGYVWAYDDTAAVTVARFDSLEMTRGGLYTEGVDSVAVRGGTYVPTSWQFWPQVIGIRASRFASLVGAEVTGGLCPYEGVYGCAGWVAAVADGDSVRADSLWFHDNVGQSALWVDSVRVLAAYGSRFERNGISDPYVAYYLPTLKLIHVSRARIAHNLFDERGDNVQASIQVLPTADGGGGGPPVQPAPEFASRGGVLAGVARARSWVRPGAAVTGPTSVVVDSTTFLNPRNAVYASGRGVGYGDTVVLRGVRVARSGGSYGAQQMMSASNVQHAAVLASTIDSSDGLALDISSGTAEVRGSTFHSVGGALNAVSASGDSVVVTENTVECAPSGSMGLNVADAIALVSNNTVRGCENGIIVWGYYTPRRAVIRSNTVVLDSATGYRGIQVWGGFDRPVVAGNEVGPGRLIEGGIILYGGFAGIDSARVDSNTVHDGSGVGIWLGGALRGVTLDSNTVRAMRSSSGAASESGVYLAFSGQGARLRDNRLLGNRVPGIRVASSSDTIRLERNVIVDDSLAGIYVDGIGTTVRGAFNYLARNQWGILGTSGVVVMDSSVFTGNTATGASGVTSWNLRNNYWGDASGPRCGPACPGALGDSVAGIDTTGFRPFLTSAPSTPTGAPPALRAAPSRRVADRAWHAAGAQRVRPAVPSVRPRTVSVVPQPATREARP